MTTIPTPKSLFGATKVVAPTLAPAPEYPAAPKPPRMLAAHIDLDAPVTGIVRPGLTGKVVTQIHDGAVKTKRLQRGQRVRPLVHGEPKGAERVVGNVRRLPGGASYEITWLSPHAAETKAASYRWFDESWVGQEYDTVVHVPALVPYQEV